VQEVRDALPDLVADRADVVHGVAGGVGDVPVLVAASRQQRGGKLAITSDLASGAAGASVLYTDGWPRQAHQPGPVRDAFLRIQITAATLGLLAPDGVLMHCMPVGRGDEVTQAAFADPRSITVEAKANLGPTHTAILEYALAR
jgi:ornithine carbamoyltransferase